MRDGLLLCELHAHTTWSDGELRGRVFHTPFALERRLGLPIAA